MITEILSPWTRNWGQAEIDANQQKFQSAIHEEIGKILIVYGLIWEHLMIVKMCNSSSFFLESVGETFKQ
jgi:hypothetical protein